MHLLIIGMKTDEHSQNSVAIVAILEEVEPSDQSYQNSTFWGSLNETEKALYEVPVVKRYNLSDAVVSQMIASYFLGYTLFSLPAGRLSELFGAKHVLGFSTLVSGILTLVLPFLLDWHPAAFIVARIIIGAAHASVLSCSITFFTEWLPKEQRFLAITITNVGYESGGVCSFILTGLICSNDKLGWRYSFYLFAVPALLWFIPYCWLVYSRPDDDPNLSDYERKLVEVERSAEYSNQDLTKENMVRIAPKLNWMVVLTSKPVIASW